MENRKVILNTQEEKIIQSLKKDFGKSRGLIIAGSGGRVSGLDMIYIT